MAAQAKPRFLMCPPAHFEVAYAINPWMDPSRWARERSALASLPERQWAMLHDALRELGAEIDIVPPAPELPDLVFTANAAVALDGVALLARFRHAERAREEPHYEAAFRSLQAHGVIDKVRKLPDGIVLEGAGDCVHDATRGLFWLGYGQRSDARARRVVEETFGVETLALELADPRFYHMDTALCPLPRGEVLYVPQAFTRAGLAQIAERVSPADRIEVAPEDAERLAANAVALGDAVIMSECSDRLRARLAERGYRVVTTPLSAFLRSGGSAFCLTLRLDRRSGAARLPETAVA